MPHVRAAIVLFGIWLLGGAASAAPIATFDDSVFHNSSDAIQFSLVYSDIPSIDAGAPTIEVGDGQAVFDLLTPIGTTITIAAVDDPDFAAFEALLTDGLVPPSPDLFGHRTLGLPAGGSTAIITSGSECALIAGWTNGSCAGGVDLVGYDIQSVTWELLSIAPSLDGLDASVRVTIHGELVPEPGIAVLLAAGLLAAFGTARSRDRAPADPRCGHERRAPGLAHRG